MQIETVGSFLDALRDSNVLSEEQLRSLRQEGSALFEQPKALAKDLIERGWLTRFQAKRILLGKGKDLTLGTYCFLEKLGEGGMGHVYKALHVPMNRIVAVKVLRPEMMADMRAMKRFRRE